MNYVQAGSHDYGIKPSEKLNKHCYKAAVYTKTQDNKIYPTIKQRLSQFVNAM